MISRPANGVVSVLAGGVAVSSEIRRTGESFVTLLDGSVVGGPAGLDFALYRLTTNLRSALPPVAPSGWQVTAEGEREGNFHVTFRAADFRFEADDQWWDAVWTALQELPRHTLSDAIESAAELVRRFIGPDEPFAHDIADAPAI